MKIRRMSNGEQVSRLAGFAMRRKPSPDFCGYPPRHAAFRGEMMGFFMGALRVAENPITTREIAEAVM